MMQSHAMHLEKRGDALASRAATLRSIVVVIPTLNEEANVRRVIDQLMVGWPENCDARLLVVDGGSHDRTRAIVAEAVASYPQLALVDNPLRTQAAAVNQTAADYAHSPDAIIVRCDAHADYPPHFVEQLVQRLDGVGADSVVVPMQTVGRGWFGRAVAFASNSFLGTGGAAHRGGVQSGWVDHGHHAAFRADSFLSNGGYDLSFTHNEDAEYDCRLRARGGRVFLAADCSIVYYPRETPRALWRQYFAYGKGRSRTVRRHVDSLRVRQLALPVGVAGLSVMTALSPWFPLLALGPLFYALVLMAAAGSLAWRHRDVSALLAGPVAAIMHVAWAWGFIFGLLTIRQPRWAGANATPNAQAHRSIESDAGIALLVDPSLFTDPYDAALAAGFDAIGQKNEWAIRPVRAGQRRELPSIKVHEIFYRTVEARNWRSGLIRNLAKVIAHPLGLKRLYDLVRYGKVKVVHFQWTVLPALDALAILLLRRRAAVVVTVHDTVPYNGDRLSFLQSVGFDWPAKISDGVIVHTQAAKAALVSRGIAPDRINIVPHGNLELSVAPEERLPRPALRDERFTFVLFGQMKPYKGIDLLVEAVGRIAWPERRRMRIVVAGARAMDTSHIEERIEELGLAGTVEMRFGRLSEPEMDLLFEEADAFAFPYRQIDASGVYYLVRGLGKWIVASRTGVFLEDFVEDVDGRTVAVGDIDALAAALVEAAHTPAKVSDRGDAVSWADIAAMTQAVYSKARERLGA